MSDKKFPTPGEIQKEFEEYFKKKFGANVQVMASPMGSGFDTNLEEAPQPPKPEIRKNKVFSFNYKPKEIKAYLDRYVVQQEEAKRALAIAVCDHYNHVKVLDQHPEKTLENYSKQNVLLLGPTGVGKTFLIKQIAKLIGVPFVKADATRFTETGYVGANVDDLIKDLVSQADGDIELAQYGIIYLDEADKLATPSNSIGRDVSGRGVQIGLLKLMEETEVDLRGGNDIASQMQMFMDFQKTGKSSKKMINTKNILFIVSGAFSGLDEIISKRLNKRAIGLNTLPSKGEEEDNLFKEVSTEDLVNYGFEPEFVGRLPVRVSCQHLGEEDLFVILKDSEGSILKQYEMAFESYGIDVYFSESGLREIARRAHSEKTGARSLMTVLEKTLRNYKFELPQSGILQLVIDERIVQDPEGELKKIIANPKYNEKSVTTEIIRQFSKKLYSDKGFNLRFSPEAVERIYEKARSTKVDPVEICQALFVELEHGLNLIRQNSGKREFLVTEEVLLGSERVLEEWIRDSYREKPKSEPL